MFPIFNMAIAAEDCDYPRILFRGTCFECMEGQLLNAGNSAPYCYTAESCEQISSEMASLGMGLI